MELFEDFVLKIVDEWRNKYASGGSISPPRIIGDKAEKYIYYRIKKSIKNYFPVISKGSRTPADIYASNTHSDFIHIMLIQVKCSTKGENKISKLNDADKKKFYELAQFVHEKYSESEFSKNHNGKSHIITTGYAGVHFKNVKHSLHDAHFIDSYPTTIAESSKNKVMKIHALQYT